MKLAILGAGPGGYVAAIKAAQLGAQVTVIEETEVGGTCLNWGCIPTKSLAASSEMLAKLRQSEDFGIELKGEIIPNLSKIIERKNKIVNTQVKGIRGLFKSWGITLKEGRGVLQSPSEIEVTLKDGSKETTTADKIIIATGSRPSQIPAFPFDGDRIISSNDAINLTDIPKSLLIVGAGVIGCEFACIFKELGSEVSIIEMLPRAVATEDIEISEQLERELKKKKIKLYTNVKVEKVDVKDDGVHAWLTDGKETVAEKTLVSIGRAFNSNGIGLERIGINKDIRGEIIVNEKMETNVPGIYAIGDVIGGLLLAHVASKEGITAAKNVMGGDERIDYSVVPAGIFTSPEIGSVGLREHQAAEKGIKVRTGHFQFRTLAKAHIMGEISGFFKIVSEETTDRILGVHIIGPHASDLIHEAAIAIKKGLKTKDIAETIHAHPTLSEGLMEAADDVHGEAIHIIKR
ncbi:MAG: dihydrolipoyl dehydrogenase [Thermodesulfovibrio sp. RBG_19FT_COMBO_41_18]|nr:MAG: dihydrolipoyl dehydrogenase [Thermodesulfovibrio sp. RBG_19FT_COMBO_41_18]